MSGSHREILDPRVARLAVNLVAIGIDPKHPIAPSNQVDRDDRPVLFWALARSDEGNDDWGLARSGLKSVFTLKNPKTLVELSAAGFKLG